VAEQVTSAAIPSRLAEVCAQYRLGSIGFPHAAQVTRKTRDLHNTRRWRTVTVYAITSLAFSRPALPASPTTCAITGRSKTACTTCATLRENAGALGGPVTCLGPLCQLWADEDELHSVSLNIGQHRSVRLPTQRGTTSRIAQEAPRSGGVVVAGDDRPWPPAMPLPR
jgi:hypothetical protein